MLTLSKYTDNNQLIKNILDLIDSKIERVLDVMATKSKEDGFTFDRNLSKILLVYKLLNSIEKYTLQTDDIKQVNFVSVDQNTFTIHCTIVRDGKEYPFSTDVIYAGGYNIQTLHIRYIVSTKLPQTKNDTLSKMLNDDIKNMSKIDRLKADNKQLQSMVDINNEIINYPRYVDFESFINDFKDSKSKFYSYTHLVDMMESDINHYKEILGIFERSANKDVGMLLESEKSIYTHYLNTFIRLASWNKDYAKKIDKNNKKITEITNIILK